MPESNENQSISQGKISLSQIEPNSASAPSAGAKAQSGGDLLQHLEKTVKGNQESSHFISPSLHFSPKNIIAQKYEIIKLISEGSSSLVYQAKHLLLNKIFAIKVLAADDSTKEITRQRFQREAHAAASLNHPNIISVSDFGILEDGTLYLVMEYLHGETLASILRKYERLHFDSAIPVFQQICLALEYAHDSGIVHRDLKPSNIMLVKDYRGSDVAKVIDFGVAKMIKHRPDQKTITQPGQIFGSPLYMSPEQCQGRKPDYRSDIYSLGCVMYETLCGVPPLMGDTMLNTIYMHVNELPTPFSQHVKDHSLPKDLEAIVFRALAKQPENRFQSARELLQALESFVYYYQQNTSKHKPLSSSGEDFGEKVQKGLKSSKSELDDSTKDQSSANKESFLPVIIAFMLLFFTSLCMIIALYLLTGAKH